MHLQSFPTISVCETHGPRVEKSPASPHVSEMPAPGISQSCTESPPDIEHRMVYGIRADRPLFEACPVGVLCLERVHPGIASFVSMLAGLSLAWLPRSSHQLLFVSPILFGES